MTNALITGSHAYGKPSEDSDIDLVVLVDPETADLLTILSDSSKYPVKFGKLNLILTDSQKVFDTWKEGTDKLKNLANEGFTPTRQQAIEFFDNLFIERGLPKSSGDSGEYYDNA